jgi:glycosyltransferase involved in cell wall biosynthesis
VRIALAADFPVHCLPGMNVIKPGHCATWLPPLAEELSHYEDFDFHWITCTKITSEYRKIHYLNQTFHLLPRRKLSIEILTRFTRERRLIASLNESLKPALLHGWGTEQGYALAANDFAVKGKSLISLQGILTACCLVTRMPLLYRIQSITEKAILAKAKHLTVESPWGADHLRKLAPHAKIELLEYGTDPACFNIIRSPSKTPSAIFLGSLTQLKGVDTLLAAFCDPRLSGIDLHIYGAGQKRFSRGDHPPNIHFHGHCAHNVILQALSHAWCLVHPTRADTSPNAVKEARVIGLPVVTTLDGGQTQYVKHGKSGFIHRGGHVDALIQGVLAVTKSRKINLLMGAADHEISRQLLTSTRTAERLIKIYQRQR